MSSKDKVLMYVSAVANYVEGLSEGLEQSCHDLDNGEKTTVAEGRNMAVLELDYVISSLEKMREHVRGLSAKQFEAKYNN